MLQRVVRWLDEATRVLIIFHEFPDGDGIASSLALARALKSLGKEADCVCKDPPPPVFSFLPGFNTIKSDFILAEYDLLCVVDCGDSKRTGFPERIKAFAQKKKKVINIDHHLKNDLHKTANLNLVDPKAAASAELVFRIVEALDAAIDKEMATLLLTGLFTDTGGFQHSNTSCEVYRLASRLLSRGARLRQLAQNIALNKPLAMLQIWGVALSRIWQTPHGMVVSLVTQDDIRRLGATVEDIAGAVNIINSIPDTKTTILLLEMPDGKIRASLRTEDDKIDVAALAAVFGGGGHRKAAGFTVEGSLRCDSSGRWQIRLA